MSLQNSFDLTHPLGEGRGGAILTFLSLKNSAFSIYLPPVCAFALKIYYICRSL